MNYILQRLREGPTWAGIAVFITGVTGVEIDKALMAQISQMGTAAAGLLLMLLPNAMGAKK